MADEPHVVSSTNKKERLKWIASLLLAIVVACSGCSFFLTVGLVARGELTARVLNADVRLWAINAQRETGLGFDRAFEIRTHRSSVHTTLHHDRAVEARARHRQRGL